MGRQLKVIIVHERMIFYSSVTKSCLIMVALQLWNRADHFHPVVSFYLLSIFYLFCSPNLSDRTLDVYHTYTHGVALVRI